MLNNSLVPAKSAELELVQYKTSDIAHATRRLVYNFAQYSGVSGTNRWPSMMHEVSTLIQGQTGFVCIWEANGLDVEFAYFLEPRPRIVEGDLIFAAPDPRITFLERPEFVSPPARTHVNRVTRAIVEEMQYVYHLQVNQTPLTLVFSRDEYASRINRFRVPLLTT